MLMQAWHCAYLITILLFMRRWYSSCAWLDKLGGASFCYCCSRRFVLRFSLVLQRLDVSGAFGHQVTGSCVLADLFTELLVITRCSVAPWNDDAIL